jgi:hypothetical protein
MVTLWNPADEAQDFILTLFFSGGHYDYPIHMEPRVTLMLDVSEIVHGQVPDHDGNMIPAAVQEGSARISGVAGEAQNILVVVEAGVYNVQKATCVYSCITCAGAVSGAVNIFSFPVGSNLQLHAMAKFNSGTTYDVTSDSTWTSKQTMIATVGAGTGLAHAVKPGFVTMQFFAPDVAIYSKSCGDPPLGCSDLTGVPGDGVGPVNPVITGVSPSQLVISSPPSTMTISGFGFSAFPGTPTVQFDGTGITTSGANVVNDSDVFADYSVSWSAPVGTQNLTVSFPGTDGGPAVRSNPWPVPVVTPACPTSTSLSSTTQELLSNVFPSELSGMGVVAAIQVAPPIVGGNWDGSKIKESWTQSSLYTCPTSPSNVWPQICSGSGTFTVGTGGQSADGQIFLAQSNIFYDQHTFDSNVSVLNYSNIQSCTAACVQTYSCNGTVVGTYNFTFQFTKGTVSGTNVTNVSVAIQ